MRLLQSIEHFFLLNRKPTKTNRRFLEDGTKVRVSKKTGQIIPKPDPLADRKPRSNGEKFFPLVLFTVRWRRVEL
jgi:hypothetical protein